MSEPTTPGREDRLGLFITVGVAALIAIGALVTGISRLVEVLPGEDVPVQVSLEGENTMLDLGSEGGVTSVALETGVVTVYEPSQTTMVASIAEPIVATLAVVAGAAIAALVLLRLARGTALARRTHIPVYVLACVTLAGGLAVDLLGAVAANSALQDLGGDDGFTFTVSLIPVVAALAIAAVGVAFESAFRLSKDTEGLV